MAMRVYKFGCRTPDVADTIVALMQRAHQYRNFRVEVELQRRKEVNDYTRSVSPELADVELELEAREAEVNELVEEVRRINSRARCKAAPAELLDRLKAAKAVRSEVAKRRKELRTAFFADPTNEATLRRISHEANARKNAERRSSGIYPGTYDLIDQAAASFISGPPPKFRPWRGAGGVGVRLTNGETWRDILAGESTLARLVRGHDRETSHTPPGERTAAKRYTLWMRIGTNKDTRKTPIWARIPVIVHRQPPDTTRVKRITLHRRTIARKIVWDVTFTLDIDTVRPVGPHDVGVDIGYRTLDDGTQRVAVAIGSDGARHELVLPQRIIGAFTSAEMISGYRDTNFNEAVEALLAWMAETERPAWLRERLADLAQWRSKRRLADVVWEWQQRTDVPGDEAILETLEAWRRRETHLDQYECFSREQAQEHRLDLYRKWVAMLRTHYGRVFVEKMNLNEAIHDVVKPKEKRTVVTEQRRKARWVALSTLLSAIKQSGMTVRAVPPEYTTLDCNACRGRCEFDAATQLYHTCEHCGARWDQDDNAARNLLAGGPAAMAQHVEEEVKPTVYERRSAGMRRLREEEAQRRQEETEQIGRDAEEEEGESDEAA